MRQGSASKQLILQRMEYLGAQAFHSHAQHMALPAFQQHSARRWTMQGQPMHGRGMVFWHSASWCALCIDRAFLASRQRF